MRRLSDAVKRRIVEHLACFATHREVVEFVAEEFDVAITPRHVRAYDPCSFQFAASQRWVDYHRLVRDRCREELDTIAIRHRAYRLHRLQQLHDRAMDEAFAESGKNLRAMREAAATLEQAAKEVGDWYTKG